MRQKRCLTLLQQVRVTTSGSPPMLSYFAHLRQAMLLLQANSLNSGISIGLSWGRARSLPPPIGELAVGTKPGVAQAPDPGMPVLSIGPRETHKEWAHGEESMDRIFLDPGRIGVDAGMLFALFFSLASSFGSGDHPDFQLATDALGVLERATHLPGGLGGRTWIHLTSNTVSGPWKKRQQSAQPRQHLVAL